VQLRAAAPPVRALWAAAAIAAAAPAALVLYRYNPLAVSFYPRCILFVATGIYCPGCGALRAAHALLHGRILTALDYNGLFVVALPFLAWAIAAQGLEAIAGRPVLPTVQLSGRMARGILWLFIVFTVLRNIPVYPFSILAP